VSGDPNEVDLSDGGDGQVITGRLESVLIGHPVDGVGDTFMDVRVASAHDGSLFGSLSRILGGDQFLVSTFVAFNSVFTFEAANLND
jgi:hypothetical protein